MKYDLKFSNNNLQLQKSYKMLQLQQVNRDYIELITLSNVDTQHLAHHGLWSLARWAEADTGRWWEWGAAPGPQSDADMGRLGGRG